MSTHNIGFYKEKSKIIPLLSSNFIKYAPYLFLVCLVFSFNVDGDNITVTGLFSDHYSDTVSYKIEPRRDKTCFLQRRKQRFFCMVTKLISAFVFAS